LTTPWLSGNSFFRQTKSILLIQQAHQGLKQHTPSISFYLTFQAYLQKLRMECIDSFALPSISIAWLSISGRCALADEGRAHAVDAAAAAQCLFKYISQLERGKNGKLDIE
jgi:hypothetical protein